MSASRLGMESGHRRVLPGVARRGTRTGDRPPSTPKEPAVNDRSWVL